MPADLSVAFHGRSAFLQVHALHDGVLAEPLLYHEFRLQALFLAFLLFHVGEQVKTFVAFVYATRFRRRTVSSGFTMRSKSFITTSANADCELE